MSHKSSVLNFREIIISGIQDLESGVQRRKSQGRDASFESKSNSYSKQVESNLPYFPGAKQEEADLIEQRKSIMSTSPSGLSNTDNAYSRLDQSQYTHMAEQVALQSFKMPSFTNPVQLSKTKNQQNTKSALKLNLFDTPNQNIINSSQKENFDSGGECTFREKKNNYNIKDYDDDIYGDRGGQDSILQKSNRRYGDDSLRQTIQSTVSYDINSERQRFQDVSNRQVSPYSSSLKLLQSENQVSTRPSSKIEQHGIQKTNIYNKNNDYFQQYDDRNEYRHQISQTLKNEKYNKGFAPNPNSRSQSPIAAQRQPINEQYLEGFNKKTELKGLNKSNSQYLPRQNPSSFNTQNTKYEKNKSTMNRSSSTKKGLINLSPPKKTTSPKKRDTLERYPSQISFTDSLRSYTPTNKMLQSKPYNYHINKENLKKMILCLESDKVRGLYNLPAFIKFFRELGLMKSKNNDQAAILSKEIHFIEELWRLLKFSSYSSECVATSFIYQIVLIVIDSKLHKTESAFGLIDTLCRREYEKYSNYFDRERDECDILPTYNILDGIRNALQFSERNEDIFEVNELLSKKSPNKKTRYDQLFEHTQFLKTDLNTKNIFSHNKSQDLKDILRESYDGQTNKSYERELNSNEKSRNLSLSKDYELELEASQNGNTSFTLKKDIHQRQYEREDYLKQRNVHERLFKKSLSKVQLTQVHHQKKEIEEQEKLQECTFKPQINRNSSKIIQRTLSNIRNIGHQPEDNQEEDIHVVDQVKGVKESLKRMEQARQQKEYKDNYWENQRLKYQNLRSRSPVSQQKNYYAVGNDGSRSTSPYQQSNHKEQAKKEKPMLYVDINITKGKSGKIAIYQGDKPAEVANNFAKIYNLNNAAKQKLIQKLENILNQYYSQLYDKF